MSRIQRTPGKGQERAEQSGLHAEGGHEEQGASIIHAPPSERFEDERPEHQRSHEKTNMLERMHRLTPERPAVGAGQMPEPEDRAAE